MASAGAREARYYTIARQSREQVNLCGACGVEVSATELLCVDCRGTLGPMVEDEGEEARRTR